MHIRWRGLELPSVVTCDTITLTSTYGKFVAEPFERGFGVTIGNSLTADHAVEPDGQRRDADQDPRCAARVQYDSRRLEDVTDVVLNVKSLVIKNHSESTKVVTVEKNETGVVSGADVR
jgi:DNA-directed RNA polymerase subunit alpha